MKKKKQTGERKSINKFPFPPLSFVHKTFIGVKKCFSEQVSAIKLYSNYK